MDAIKMALNSLISSLNIGMNERFLVSYKEHVVINMFLKKILGLDLVSENEIKGVIHTRILGVGRHGYNIHVRGLGAPDYIESPASLAFALKMDHFNEEEMKKIIYDQEESHADFIGQYYIDNFPQVLLDQLLTKPKKPKPGKDVEIGHCCC
ncbi:hypothetical protein ACFL0K_02455 [Patescibacteria group bacterium]